MSEYTVFLLYLVGSCVSLAAIGMASATRIQVPIKVIFASIAATVAASSVYGIKRAGGVEALLLKTFTGPGSTSRIIAILLVLFNIKNFPFVWHLRVFNGIFSHIEYCNTPDFSPTPGALTKSGKPRPFGPAALFQPIITRSRTPLSECDYNRHKSNSTYFSDLDVTRSHLISCLLRQGIRSLATNPGQVIMPDGSKARGRWFIMLGSVMCSFKREIKPYEDYEMWSRVLCWDRKWIYVLTHFVKAGTTKPDGYTLDDGSFSSRMFGAKSQKGEGKLDDVDREGKVNKNVFASAVSKYCMKLGRYTIHPEVTLSASGLLPPKPGGWNRMDGKPKEEDAAEPLANGNGHANGTAESNEWDWKRVEAENARGMKYAEHFAVMDGLIEEFTGEDRPALGVFRDLLW